MSEPTTLLPISIDLLDPAEDNPRTDLGDLAGLAASIAEVGILEPVIVTPGAEGRFTIIAGHRRHAAALLVNVTEIEVIVQAVDDDADRQRMMLIENLHREDLSVLDEARGYKALVDTGLTQRDIAGRVGVSQATVSKHLSLLKLPEPALALVSAGELSQEAAVTLAGLPADARKEITTEIEDGVKAAEPMSGAEVARAIEWAKRAAEQQAAIEKELADLKAAGVTFVEYGEVKWSYAKTGPVALTGMYWVKPAQHKKTPCRAVTIRSGGVIVEVCTDPKSHPQPARSTGPTAKKETPAELEKRLVLEQLFVELAAATERRQRWILGLNGNADGLTKITLEMLLVAEVAWLEPRQILADLTGADMEGSAPRDGLDAVLDAVTNERLARRALFIAIAMRVDRDVFDDAAGGLTFELSGHLHPQGQAFMAGLIQLGYEPSWIECKYLGLPYEEPQMPGTASPAAEEGASDAEAKAPVSLTGDLPADEPAERPLTIEDDGTPWTDEPAGTDSSPSDEGTESVPHRSEPAMPTGLRLWIEPKKGKFYTYCSEHGQVAYNTKEDMAQQRLELHRRMEHAGAAA